MKLRIRGNSIRIRLMQTEVQVLADTGVLSEEVAFPGGEVFTYRLGLAGKIGADMSGSTLSIHIPEQEAKDWINSDVLSLDRFVALPSGEQLRILVEKDLQCLVERENEDESDAFPNPKAC